MVKAYYKNSKGEVLWLTKAPFKTVESDWFDSNWEDSTDGYEKTVSIDVFGKREEFTFNMEKLYRVISYDSEVGALGRLYVNDTFLPCKIIRTSKSGWKGYVYSEVELTFWAPELSWITEVKKSFYPQSTEKASDGLDFPFDFPFDFAGIQRGSEVFEIDHIVPSDFEMTVYGPCVNPRVLINGYPYEVLTTLEAGEYLVIDSAEQTVVKHLSSGLTYTMDDKRNGVNHLIAGGRQRLGTWGSRIRKTVERSVRKESEDCEENGKYKVLH